MKRIALIYSFNTVKTSKIAEKIKEAFASEEIELLNAEEITIEKFLAFDI